MKEFKIRRKMLQRLDAIAIKSRGTFPIGKMKKKHQVHIARKKIVEAKEYVL